MASQPDLPSRRSSPRHFGVAALQLDLGKGDNVARIAAEIAAVRLRLPWVSLVVVGELAAHGANSAAAEAAPGPTEEAFCKVARDNGLWLVPGSFYTREGDALYNTAPVIGPDGVVRARYHKQFPFRPYEKGVAAGSEPVVFEVPGAGCFGISICYDMWFPETTRSLASLGAEVILHPTMTYTIDRDVELAIARASAATNQVYFVDVNVAGDLGVGRSIVCGPGGEVIHAAGSGRELIAFEVDFEYLRGVRERGWQGVTQPLKSFRDSKVRFPAYAAGAAPSAAFDRLGALEIPASDPGAPAPTD